MINVFIIEEDYYENKGRLMAMTVEPIRDTKISLSLNVLYLVGVLATVVIPLFV